MSDEVKHIKDLKPDLQNARKHSPRNVGMIVKSLHEVGAARSGVIDEDGNVLAGNATLEALAEAGITNVRVVDAGGEEWVVVRRKGLTEEQKRKLALYDNRTAELAGWDADILREITADGMDLSELWFEDELKDLFSEAEPPQEFKKYDENIETNHACPKCGYVWAGPCR